MAVDQCLDSIKVKSNWAERDGGDVEGWLKTNGFLGKKDDLKL